EVGGQRSEVRGAGFGELGDEGEFARGEGFAGGGFLDDVGDVFLEDLSGFDWGKDLRVGHFKNAAESKRKRLLDSIVICADGFQVYVSSQRHNRRLRPLP